MNYWLTFKRDAPISHGYMYVFILLKYLIHAIVELTLWTALTECRYLWVMYILKMVMHQCESMYPSFHLSIKVLKSYVTCLSMQLSHQASKSDPNSKYMYLISN